MPKLHFMKMNGAGNDFVMLDNRAGDLRLTREQIARLCDRHRGIGADGVLMLEPASNGADFRMRYYNADGGEAEMCGNGARCFARFTDRLAGPLEKLTFETPAGVISAQLEGASVTLRMGDPKDLRRDLCVLVDNRDVHCQYIDSGVPHVVVSVPALEEVEVAALGRALRQHEQFAPRGTNVNFFERCGGNRIAIRTYERGVEAETLACGTGVVASAIIFALLDGIAPPIKVCVAGGDELSVDFRQEGEQITDVTLSGPADFVFEGSVEL